MKMGSSRTTPRVTATHLAAHTRHVLLHPPSQLPPSVFSTLSTSKDVRETLRKMSAEVSAAWRSGSLHLDLAAPDAPAWATASPTVAGIWPVPATEFSVVGKVR
jgi:hypothetical protein